MGTRFTQSEQIPGPPDAVDDTTCTSSEAGIIVLDNPGGSTACCMPFTKTKYFFILTDE